MDGQDNPLSFVERGPTAYIPRAGGAIQTVKDAEGRSIGHVFTAEPAMRNGPLHKLAPMPAANLKVGESLRAKRASLSNGNKGPPPGLANLSLPTSPVSSSPAGSPAARLTPMAHAPSPMSLPTSPISPLIKSGMRPISPSPNGRLSPLTPEPSSHSLSRTSISQGSGMPESPSSDAVAAPLRSSSSDGKPAERGGRLGWFDRVSAAAAEEERVNAAAAAAVAATGGSPTISVGRRSSVSKHLAMRDGLMLEEARRRQQSKSALAMEGKIEELKRNTDLLKELDSRIDNYEKSKAKDLIEKNATSIMTADEKERVRNERSKAQMDRLKKAQDAREQLEREHEEKKLELEQREKELQAQAEANERKEKVDQHRELRQLRWLVVVSLASRLDHLVQMVHERRNLQLELVRRRRAVRVLQTWYREKYVKVIKARYVAACVVIQMRVRKWLVTRMHAMRARSAHLLLDWLRDLTSMNDMKKAISRFKRSVLRIQKSLKQAYVTLMARREVLMLQWEKHEKKARELNARRAKKAPAKKAAPSDKDKRAQRDLLVHVTP
eukprot:jgi/Mesvir1/27510/Mv07276-RA.1